MGHNLDDSTDMKIQVLIHPNIEPGSEARESTMKILNTLLADEAVLAMKTHRARSRAHGPGFFEMQTLFDQQIHQLNKVSDEIAERVRMLGGFAISSFEEFLRYARLEELPGEAPELMGLLADHEAFIRSLREDARKCSEEYEDEGTFELLVPFMRQHEKMAWMLRSYIEPELPHEEKMVA